MYILFIYTAFEDLMRVDCKENLLRSTPDVLKTQVYIKNKWIYTYMYIYIHIIY